MIKVIEEKPVPTAQIRCPNCDSLLEYGNADLHEDMNTNLNIMHAYVTDYHIHCPVCGCEVKAHWIFNQIKKGGKK